MVEIDLGARCSDHVGEVFPPRCSDCDQATVRNASDRVAHRLGFIPGSACSSHRDYPLPCALCDRNRSTEQGLTNG